MELSSLIFSATTTDLERASTVIASLVQDMSRVSVASANMARISAQTEAILARAATESAKARKENARAADIEIKTIIAADKADADRAESIRKAAEAERRRTEGTEESTRAAQRNVSILQRQSDILEFQAQGWSKGQSSILATAKAANIAADEMEKLQKVLETQRKLMGSSPFDNSLSGLTTLKNQYGELRESIRQYNTDSDLTSKQTKELARDKERLIEKMKTENASFSEIRAAVRAHNDEYVKLAGQYNNLAQAEANVIKNRKAVASATDYLTSADQKLAAALNTSNAAIDRSGTDLLVKYEAALRKSGVAQDVATQKLAAYKTQLVQVQDQEQKRREEHLTRGLAPQATDIVVSLWSGQNPLTVLLQQGGQISDMFMTSGVAAEDFAKVVRESLASMVPAMMTVATGIADVLGGMFVDAGASVLDFISDVSGISAVVEQAQRWIVSAGEASFRWIGVMQRFGERATKVMAVGILALVTALTAMAMKYKEIIQSEYELSKALALNGGAMDMTKESAIAYADSMKQVGVGNLKAQEAMTAFINAGAMGAETMDAAREAAVALEKYAGIALSDTAKEFAKLQDEPSKALIEIAKKTGQVEKATLDVISALEEEQGASAAAAAATVYAADAKKKAADEIKASLSPIETLWYDIKSAIGKVGQAIYDLSKSEKTVKVLSTVWQAFAVSVAETWYVLKQTGITLGGIAAGYAAFFSGDFEGARNIGKDMKEGAAAARVEHDKLIASLMITGDVEEKQHTKKKAQNSEYAKWLEDNAKALAKSQSKEEEFATKKKQLQADLKKGLIDEVKYNEALAGWKRVIMGEDKKPKAAPKDTFYETSMTKFRDASIAASDATKELTKSQIELMQTVADPKFLALSKQKQNDILQSGAAAIAIEKQKEAVIDLQKAEEFRDKILGKSEGLGKDYYAQMEALPKHAASLKLTTEQTDELIRKIYQGTPVWQKYNKSLEQADEALRKFTESSIAYQASTNAENQELDHRISLLGKTSEEQRKLQIEYQRETKINATRVELEKKLRDIAKERAEAEGKGVRDTKKLQEFADAEVQARQDAAERIKVINKGVAVEYASDLDKEIAAIRGSISDSIVTALFEGGKEGSKKLRSVLVDVLREKFTIVVDAVVNTLVGNVVGGLVGGAGGSAAGGVASSIGSSAVGGLASNALGTLGAFGGAVQGFGTAALAATQSMMGMTGTVAQMSTSLAAAGHTAAAGMQSGIAAFQAIPGWGWALAGIALLAGTMDFGGEQRFGGGYQLNGNKEVKYTAGPGGGQINQAAQEAVVNETYKSINSILKSLGSTLEVIDFYAGLETSGKGKGGTFAGGKLSSGAEFGKKWQAGMYSQNLTAEEAVNQFAGQMKIVTVEALKAATDIPVYLQEELKKVDVAKLTGDTAGLVLEETNRMYTLFSTVKGALELLNKPMFDTTTAGYALTESFVEMFGGIEGLKTSISSYYDNFYSEAEKELNIRNQLTAALSEQNLVIPTTREAYRQLVEAQDLTTEAGRANYAVLLKNAGAFAELTPAASAANKQIAGLNKMFAGLGVNTKLAETKFDKATKEMFESLGVSVEEYSNSIADVIAGIATGKIPAEDAGKALADAAVGGITNAIAQGASQAIAAQFVNSIITPIIANIMAGNEALAGINLEAGLANLQTGVTALGTVLQQIGPAIGGIAAEAATIISGSVAGVQGATTTSSGGVTTPGLFAIGGSAVNNNMYRSPEAQSLTELTNQTLNSNLKVSELLQKLLNPEKLFENKYKALDDQLIQQRKELSRTNVGGGLGVNESTLQADIDALRLKIADNTSVRSIIDPMMRALEHTVYNPTTDGLKAADSIFEDLAKLIVERSEGTPSSLGGYSIGGNAGDPIQKRIQDTIEESFYSAIGEDNLDWFNEFINGALGITSSSFNDNLDLQAKIAQMAELETKLREWYIAQARVIAVEDMSALATETTAAKAKTAELKRTGGLEDPVTKLKEQLAQKMQAIDEGIGKALLAEVDVLKGQKTDTSKIEALLSTQTGRRDLLTADGYLSDRTALLSSEISRLDSGRAQQEQQSLVLQAAWRASVGTDNEAYAASAYNNHIMTLLYLNDQRRGFENELTRLNNGGLTDDINAINAAITKTEDELTAAILAATDPAKQEALLAEIAKYKGGITEWYKAQADLLSTEMLVDINKQIKELETSEKGPLTTIKDAIQKYIDDFKALGTLTDDIQTQIDKLSGLQLTKARKSLYDQLLSPEELKTRDTLALTSEFSKLGKVIPDSTSSLRAMIDAANAAGNTTLADSLLELVPAFIALQNSADGVGDALSKLRSDTDEAYAALERAVEAQRKVLNDLITNLRAVFDAAKAGAKTLYKEVDSVKRQSAEAGNLFINEALKALRLNGAVPDSKELQDAMDASIQGVTDAQYETAFDEMRGRLVLAGKLTEIADLTEPQLTLAEKQLKDLDQILETARAQIDELRGINTSVLSVVDAVNALAIAIASEKAQSPLQDQQSSWDPNDMVFIPGSGGGGSGGGGSDLSLNEWGQQLLDKNASVYASDKFKSASEDQITALKSGSTGGNIYLTADAALTALKAADPSELTAAGMVQRELTLAKNSGLSMDDRTDYAYGKISAEDLLKKYEIPGFDVGINNVPYDMPAYLHAGESVIPSEFNPFNPSASTPLSLTPIGTSGVNQTQDNSDIIEENRLLRQELQAQNGAMVRLLSKVARVVERWDGDGLPEPRTETA